jgi:hypothetical protein
VGSEIIGEAAGSTNALTIRWNCEVSMSTAARNPSPEEPGAESLRPVTPPAVTNDISRFEQAKAAARNFSIVVGGPVYDSFLRIGLVRRGLLDVRPRIIALLAIAGCLCSSSR